MNKTNLTWFTLGSLASSSLSFISIPIIAWVFPDADIGKVALLISASGLATIFFSMGMDQSYTREFHEAGDRAALLLNAAVPGATLMLAVALLILLIEPTAPSRALFGEDSPLLSAFILGYLFIVLISRFLTLSLRMEEDGRRYALSFLLAKLTFVSAVCIAYRTSSPGLKELLIAHGISVSAGLFYLISCTLPTFRQIKPSQFCYQSQRKLLAYGLPVASSGLLFWGLEGVDKFLLRTFSSYSELGVYSIALSISAIATVLTSMFTTVWVPVVYRWIAKGEELGRIDEVTRHVLAGTLILIGLIGTFSWILQYVLPSKHSIVQTLIPACMLWPILYAVSETTGLGIAVKRATKFGLIAAGVALGSNVLLNLILLPSFGSRGAAAALATSIWIFFFMRTEISHHVWRKTQRSELYSWTLVALIIAVAHALAGGQAASWFSVAWGLFVAMAAINFRHSLRAGKTAAISLLRSSRNTGST